MKKQVGASLIEAMVAVLIVGFGLLGVGAMQSRAIAMNQSAHYRGIAADLAADLAERVRALRSPFMAGPDTATAPPAPPDFARCQLQTDLTLSCANQTNGSAYGPLANAEMTAWNALRASQMSAGSRFDLTSEPSGTSGFFRYTLTLTWLDNRQDNSNVSYRVVIE